jgi:hypothetical protein
MDDEPGACEWLATREQLIVRCGRCFSESRFAGHCHVSAAESGRRLGFDIHEAELTKIGRNEIGLMTIPKKMIGYQPDNLRTAFRRLDVRFLPTLL